MVRTKADSAGGSSSRKAVGASAPRKSLGSASTSKTVQSPGTKYGGGNSYCPRPTPDWQKGISMFLASGKDKENARPKDDDDDDDDDLQVTPIDQTETSGNINKEITETSDDSNEPGPSTSK